MTRLELLMQLKAVTDDEMKDLLLPVRMQKGDAEPPKPRAPEVYIARLPDGKSADKKAPYILHQVITAKDSQKPGEHVAFEALIRSIFCVYNPNETEGALALLTIMDRMRIRLLKQVVIGGRFQLDLEAGLETLVYPDDTAPYFIGEMASTWALPPITREGIRSWL